MKPVDTLPQISAALRTMQICARRLTPRGLFREVAMTEQSTKVHNLPGYERKPHSHIVRRVKEKAQRAFWKGGSDDLVQGHADPEMVSDTGDCA